MIPIVYQNLVSVATVETFRQKSKYIYILYKLIEKSNFPRFVYYSYATLFYAHTQLKSFYEIKL